MRELKTVREIVEDAKEDGEDIGSMLLDPDDIFYFELEQSDEPDDDSD